MATHAGRYGNSKRKQIIQFLREPRSKNFTRFEIARQFDCTHVYVSRIAGELGMARRYKGDRVRRCSGPRPISITQLANDIAEGRTPIQIPEGSESLRTITTESQVQEIASSKTLSTEQQRQSLSWLAVNAGRDEAKVAAHRALQTLDANLGLQTKLGPSEPLTIDDKILRLSLLMQACGKEIVNASIAKAFPESPADPNSSPTGGDNLA